MEIECQRVTIKEEIIWRFLYLAIIYRFDERDILEPGNLNDVLGAHDADGTYDVDGTRFDFPPSLLFYKYIIITTK